MRASTSAAFLTLAAGSAMAQTDPVSIGKQLVGYLSTSCQATLGQLVNQTSPQYQCLQIDALLPAILTNDSIIPPVDNYLSAVCYSEPCNSTVLNDTITAVVNGCGSDFAQFGVSNETVTEVLSLYPLALEVACLKTTNATSFDNASIPINSTSYNSTNGTFCLTDLATDISGYLGVNLTNQYIDTLLLGGNSTGLQALESIPPSALCSDCIFAAVDIIEGAYPQLGEIVVNSTMNATVNSFLNSTCAVTGYNVTTNGTVPETIDNTIEEEGFFNDTTSAIPTSATLPSEAATILSSLASATSAAAPVTSAAASATSAAAQATGSSSLSGRMAEKRRWFGKW